MSLLGRQTQKCPRCGGKALVNQYKCPDCGLVFAKLEMATNKEAAKRYKAKERDAIVFTKKVPSDLKRWKLILFGTLFSIVGGHYFYTRRWWWGLVYLLGFLFTCAVTFCATYYYASLKTFVDVSSFFVGVYGLCWIYELVRVCLGRFKIPVSLPKGGIAEIMKAEGER